MSFDQPTFTARYAGRCPECRGGINEGDQVTRLDDDLMHAECASGVTGIPTLVRSPCAVCWQIPSVAGKCGCEVPL